MLPGTVHLAVLAFTLLFLWVPFALAAWALDRLDPLTRGWHVLPRLERHRVGYGDQLRGTFNDPIPLPAHYS